MTVAVCRSSQGVWGELLTLVSLQTGSRMREASRSGMAGVEVGPVDRAVPVVVDEGEGWLYRFVWSRWVLVLYIGRPKSGQVSRSLGRMVLSVEDNSTEEKSRSGTDISGSSPAVAVGPDGEAVVETQPRWSRV